MNEFTRNLDELLYLSGTKNNMVRHLRKNYRENIHYINYIVEKDNLKNTQQNGGQNKIVFMLTESVYELLKNSYNLRNRYIVDISDKVKYVNIGMCIENQTIGFIENAYSKEYQRWKKSLNKEVSDNDMKDIKDYLNSCEYTLKATVWTDQGSNEGYYGLSLKSDEHKHKKTSSTGKRVEKREVGTEHVLSTWETIAKAAQYEGVCASKMSLGIKNKAVFKGNYYYCTITQ